MFQVARAVELFRPQEITPQRFPSGAIRAFEQCYQIGDGHPIDWRGFQWVSSGC